jgi:hypothetical protein
MKDEKFKMKDEHCRANNLTIFLYRFRLCLGELFGFD